AANNNNSRSEGQQENQTQVQQAATTETDNNQTSSLAQQLENAANAQPTPEEEEDLAWDFPSIMFLSIDRVLLGISGTRIYTHR
ncbi:MAG: hypothetical protein ABSA33_07450, partial [Candidatus Micrarchaeaceae archaeon]